jgi:trimeric autotransporter adhesin
MGKKLRSKLTTMRGLIVVVGLVFALTWAMPAMGASPLKLAKKALAKATLALNTANDAKKTANTAQSAANSAQTTADEAKAAANGISQTAYARMDNPCSTSSACSIDHAKGISGIRQTSTGGLYCVTAAGKNPSTTAAVVSVDAGDTGAAVDSAQAQPNSNGAACNSGEFEVQTTRVGAGNSTTVAFFIQIP